MQTSSEWAQIPSLPKPANLELLKTAQERWEEQSKRGTSPEIETLNALRQAHPVLQQLLEAIWGNSPYLTQLIAKHPDFLVTLFTKGNDLTLEQSKIKLNESLARSEKIEDLMSTLRLAKQTLSLQLAINDISGLWPVEMITYQLSHFAKTSLQAATRFVLQRAQEQNELRLSDPETPEKSSGFIVLAMGKLGAFELNYSSDIDLIVFFDRTRFNYQGQQSAGQLAIKLTRDLVRIMEERTRDGYVFRTDLRLRPDPSSTPLAISTEAALRYYESVGQNWERAAMIKALTIAGDVEAGENFLEELRPYVWRKYLDFAAIQDIHSIKRQISSKKSDIPTELYGYNIKLGHGGIREIEFFVQTQQLIWGGRLPTLRVKPTTEALQALAAHGKIKPETAEELCNMYRFLRTLEHRLQMVADMQTHTLPESAERYTEIACFMGYDNELEFSKTLRQKLLTVQKHYERLFKSAPALSAEKSLVFTGVENDPETVANLGRIGFKEPATIAQLIRQWHHGRHRATRSKRARELLTELTPSLLKEFAETVDPDSAFLHFDEFLSTLPTGVQPFSLFNANPHLLNLIAELMGSFPYLADNLAHKPALLEYVLYPDFLEPLATKEALEKDLQQALRHMRDYEEILNTIRRWTHERQFKIGIHLVRHKITPRAARGFLSDIAEAVLTTLLKRVEKEFSKQRGVIKGSESAILALGKLGSQEITFDSDIDIIFLYTSPAEEDAHSDGAESLSLSQYYNRLSRRFITAFTTLTPEGKLYEVDMRLRPSGNEGMLASSISAFDRYYEQDAWEVERMALCRARVLSAGKSLTKTLEQLREKHLCSRYAPEQSAAKVRDIREKIFQQRATNDPWNVKHVRGGLVDCEFLAQFLAITHAKAHPNIAGRTIEKIFENLGDLKILAPQTAQELGQAYSVQLDVQTLLRLVFSSKVQTYHFTSGVEEFLTKSLGFSSIHHIQEHLEKHQARVREEVEKFL